MFSNASIRAPVKRKPHICKREGWWRVSRLRDINLRQWDLAHTFAAILNREGTRHDRT